MWRSQLSSLYNRAVGRRLVGKDNHGNLFFLQASTEPGKAARRVVEHPSGAPDSSSMDIEWWAWLHGRREEEDIPLPAELQRAAKARDDLAERVSVIDAEDEKDRLRGLGSASVKRESTPAERKRAALMQLASSPDVALSDRPVPSQRHPSQGAEPEHEQSLEPTVRIGMSSLSAWPKRVNSYSLYGEDGASLNQHFCRYSFSLASLTHILTHQVIG